MERISFHNEISRNKTKSFFLIVIMFIFFLVLGYLISLVFDRSYFFLIMIISVLFSILYVVIGYYNSDKIALASVRARPASMAEHKIFYDSAENMSLASGLPKPKLYIMDSEQINAFASGRNPENAVICVTSGCLKKLNKQELEGVIAHEMSHIANYDIRYMTLAAVLIGMISIIAQIFLRSLWFSGGKKRGKNQAIILIIAIVFAILAPIVVNLVALSISRKREFAADATAVKFTRYPPGLRSALKKIKEEHLTEKDKHHYPKATASLFISNPFRRKNSGLFLTHPPIEERIKKLERM